LRRLLITKTRRLQGIFVHADPELLRGLRDFVVKAIIDY